MTSQLVLTQLLNGVQLGMLLFLLSAGLTLVFGIMGFVHLAHGSFYMMGAYFAATVYDRTSSFLMASLVGIPATFLLGLLVERLVLKHFYQRDHLYQVLVTLGLIIFFNEMVSIIWGMSPVYVNTPEFLLGTVDLLGLPYPAYRFAIIVLSIAVALGIYWLIHRTRVGMLIRAGASNERMVGALGINIKLLNSMIFGLGAALAGLAGLMAGPILSVQPRMGEPILIMTLVVIVTGGIGSVRGALYAALILGMVDTAGRAFMPIILQQLFGPAVGKTLGPTVASILIYLLMAVVLAVRPGGLFPIKHG